MLRRTLVRILGASGLGAWLPAPRAAAAADPLLALGTAVLPASLGSERIASVVVGFRNWLRDYKPGADRGHGYGHVRLMTAPPSPAEHGHAAQLAALDAAAQRLGAASFATLPATGQKTVLADALRAAKVERLPERPDGRHVAADLLAFFFRSSEANDLAYRAEIGRETCRGLPGSEAKPAALNASSDKRSSQTSAPRVHLGS